MIKNYDYYHKDLYKGENQGFKTPINDKFDFEKPSPDQIVESMMEESFVTAKENNSLIRRESSEIKVKNNGILKNGKFNLETTPDILKMPSYKKIESENNNLIDIERSKNLTLAKRKSARGNKKHHTTQQCIHLKDTPIENSIKSSEEDELRVNFEESFNRLVSGPRIDKKDSLNKSVSQEKDNIKIYDKKKEKVERNEKD